MSNNNEGPHSSFVIVESNSSISSNWVYVGDPVAEADQNRSHESKARWTAVEDAQKQRAALDGSAPVEVVGGGPSRPIETAIPGSVSSSVHSGSVRSVADSLGLSAEDAAILRAHLLAEEQAAIAQAAPPSEVPRQPRQCDCLGASSDYHRSNCPFGAASAS